MVSEDLDMEEIPGEVDIIIVGGMMIRFLKLTSQGGQPDVWLQADWPKGSRLSKFSSSKREETIAMILWSAHRHSVSIISNQIAKALTFMFPNLVPTLPVVPILLHQAECLVEGVASIL